MKLELLVAILLLAGGGYLWTTQGSNGPFAAKTVEKPASNDAESTRQSSADSAQMNASGQSDDGANYSDTSNSKLRSTDNRANLLLKNAASNMLNSPSIQTSAELKVDLFGQQFSANGRYFQRGQSSGHARLEIEYAVDENQSGSLVQICDGRFYYCVHKTPEQKSLQYFELQPLATADRFSIGAKPAAWMTTGGLSSLLEHLAHSFEFEPPTKTKIGGISALCIRGTWKRTALKNMLQGQAMAAWLEPEIQWHRLPRQLPHAVEICLGSDDFLPLFPYRISFLQYKNQPSDSAPDTPVKIADATRPVVTLRFSDVEKIESLPDAYFVVNSEDADPLSNLTDDYATRMSDLSELHRTAQNEDSKTNR